ncbi:hypothetical protein G9A89_023675 [Geosiphon pyriformis]|nr:hypothetical protein G9A89_023675 [Geosiphon pyriformis]
MTYIGKFNKLFRQICQLKTNNYYSDAQILDQFIAEDLNSAIQYAKRYKMAIKEANRTKLQLRKKLTNSQRRLKTISPINNNSNSKDINHPKDDIKITLHHFPITNLRIAITVESLAIGKEIAESCNETNKIGVINVTLHHSNLIINHHHQLTIHQDLTIPATIYTTLSSTHSKTDYTKSTYTTKLIPNSTTTTLNPEFYHTAPSESRAAAQQQNPFHNYTTIPPFEANELPFLLSNAAANEQKAITAMYTKTEVEEKTIRLILNSGSTGSIITYQLMQQLKRNVDRPAQTVIVTADGMKKTPVEEINNFPFTLDGITISVKVLIMDAPQYQALKHKIPATCGTFNKCSEKAPAFEFELEEKKPLIETFMALGSTSNWANETEQEHFISPETSGWNIPYSKPEPRKQRPYIPLKCKDCHKKLSSMGACISPEEEYENHTCYYCKACHKE